MARSFNGTTDRIDAPTTTPVTPTGGPFSVAAWVNMSSLPASAAAVYSRFEANVGGSGANAFTQLFVLSTGQLAYFISKSGGAIDIDPGTATLTTGVWAHVGFSCDTSGNLATYVNGVSDGTVAGGAAPLSTNFSGATGPSIGYDTNTAGRNLGGSIADVAVWSAVITPSQFAALAAGVRPYRIQRAKLQNYWPLEGTASPEPDVINGNNGTLTGTTGATSQFVAARSFNGSTDQINCTPASAHVLQTAAMTQAAWVNLGTLSNAYNQLTGWASAVSGCHIMVKSTGKLAMYVTDSTPTSYNYDGTGTNTLTSGVWYHVVMTYSAATGPIGYVNGAVDGSNVAGGLGLQDPVAVQSWFIGADPGTAGRNLPGNIADVAQWNVALTQNEIIQLYRGVRPSSIRGGSLAGYWPLGLGSPEPDKSINGNNGTLTGTTQTAGPSILIPVGA